MNSFTRVCAVLFTLVCSSPLHAGTPDLFGMGSRATSLGGAFTGVADDFSAVYYNPAGIAGINEATLTVAPIFAQPRIWIAQGNGQQSAALPNASGMYLGITAPLGKLMGIEGLGIGITLYTPMDFVVDAAIPARTDTLFLPVIQDSYRRMSATVVLGYQITADFSVGLGLDLFMDLGGSTVVALGGPQYQWKQRQPLSLELRRDINLDPAIYAGLLYKLGRWLNLGLSYRMEETADTFFSPNAFSLGTIDLDMTVALSSFFRPHQVTVGIASRPLDNLLICADLTWAHWAAFKGPHTETPEPAFNDAWIPRVGLETQLASALSLAVGYFYYPTPVPTQQGQSSFVDSDRHAFSGGFNWDLRKMQGSWKLPISLGVHMQVQLLDERHTKKNLDLLPDADPSLDGHQVSSPGYPNFSSGGSLLQGGATMELHF
ncbi:MAG TPA: hypothetical protein EYN66_02600 [Myxococcales bacterium]|nr:hypothetical protein [Myxococcales bacterium]